MELGGRPQSGNAIKGADAAARDVTLGHVGRSGDADYNTGNNYDTGVRATNRPPQLATWVVLVVVDR